jgi:cysteine synthase A
MAAQMRSERFPVPSWIVVGAGTGGTSATIGRYLRYHRLTSRLCVADPAGSVFKAYFETGDATLTSGGSRIEGIGRPRVEASFIRTVIDRMIEVPDTVSVAAMCALNSILGRRVGPSTGTNFAAVLQLAEEMLNRGEQGSILSLICDPGERYLASFYDADWVAGHIGDCSDASDGVQSVLLGVDTAPVAAGRLPH